MSSSTSDSERPKAPPGFANQNLAIFLISVLGLFLELILIRWISTEVRIFAYLQNTVLVVCFLGIGMGCFSARQEISVRQILYPLAFLTILLSFPLTRIGLHFTSDMLALFSNINIWIWHQADLENTTEKVLFFLLGLGIAFILMALIWDMFVPVGRLLGRLMDDHERPIQAYSMNVAGSLVGSWILVALSFIYAPPIIWLSILVLLLLGCFYRQIKGQMTLLMTLAVIVVMGYWAGQEPNSIQTLWTPYQKLTLSQSGPDAPVGHDYVIHVNNTGYQAMIDLSQDDGEVSEKSTQISQYDVPYMVHPNLEDVLIVGAGSGNDVAGALRNGAEHVVAVEIDYAIQNMGMKYHPEQPYSSQKVEVVIDDARSYFATSRKKYDVISFGLLDSHTTTSLTNARLDHYVYTRESFEAVKNCLKPGGIMVVNFEAQHEFIADRIGHTLKEVFGESPLHFGVPSNSTGWGGVIFVAGDTDQAFSAIEANPALNNRIEDWRNRRPVSLSYTTRIATDDWPYLYLAKPMLPRMYLILGMMLVLLFWRGQRSLENRDWIQHWGKDHWHFFFLGAAFMLLEVQNISKASVVLGNTWWVNSVVISGVLLMILIANAVAYRFPGIKVFPIACLLIGSCIGLYFIDLARFASLPYVTKSIVVGALTTLPMLFSGIFFIRSFASSSRKDLALGANLLGALFGGLGQALTFLIGVKALLLVVAALYLCAILTTPDSADTATTLEEIEKSDELEFQVRDSFPV